MVGGQITADCREPHAHRPASVEMFALSSVAGCYPWRQRKRIFEQNVDPNNGSSQPQNGMQHEHRGAPSQVTGHDQQMATHGLSALRVTASGPSVEARFVIVNPYWR